MTLLAIIIVNYRTANLVIDCLRSLVSEVNQEDLHCRVIVVDNHSEDDSAEKIKETIQKEGWTSWVELQVLNENRGFGAGNNAAFRSLLEGLNVPDLFWLLNPDTIVKPGSLRPLVDFHLAHPHVGIVGSGLENPDESPQQSVFRFPSIVSEFENGFRLGLVSWLLSRYLVAPQVKLIVQPTDWVCGASMMVKKEVLTTVGIFDEDYFLYYEETDLCLRARRASWECWFVPSARIIHVVGQSSGVKDGKLKVGRIPRYLLESRAHYFTKNHGWLYRFFADLTWAGAFFLWRIRRKIQRKPDTDPPYMLYDFCMFNFFGGSRDSKK